MALGPHGADINPYYTEHDDNLIEPKSCGFPPKIVGQYVKHSHDFYNSGFSIAGPSYCKDANSGIYCQLKAFDAGTCYRDDKWMVDEYCYLTGSRGTRISLGPVDPMPKSTYLKTNYLKNEVVKLRRTAIYVPPSTTTKLYCDSTLVFTLYSSYLACRDLREARRRIKSRLATENVFRLREQQSA